MADDADQVNERDLKADRTIHSFRYTIPAGVPGECENCEKYSKRLIAGLCARCRDNPCR